MRKRYILFIAFILLAIALYNIDVSTIEEQITLWITWIIAPNNSGVVQAIGSLLQAFAAFGTFFLMWRLGKEQTRINTTKAKVDIYDDLTKYIEDCTAECRRMLDVRIEPNIKMDSPTVSGILRLADKRNLIKKMKEKIYFVFDKNFSKKIESLIDAEVNKLEELGKLYFDCAIARSMNNNDDDILSKINQEEKEVTAILEEIKNKFREKIQF